jgi:hypothetical protein
MCNTDCNSVVLFLLSWIVLIFLPLLIYNFVSDVRNWKYLRDQSAVKFRMLRV